MPAEIKTRKERSRRIVELRKQIAATYAAELENAATPSDRKAAFEIASAQVQYEENELTVLEQHDLQAKLDERLIVVPHEYWNGEEWPLKRTLLPSGEKWARKQLRDYRDSRIEFYAKIVLPIASLIVSLIALIKKNH